VHRGHRRRAHPGGAARPRLLGGGDFIRRLLQDCPFSARAAGERSSIVPTKRRFVYQKQRRNAKRLLRSAWERTSRRAEEAHVRGEGGRATDLERWGGSGARTGDRTRTAASAVRARMAR
jgi:hypothetical protein